MKGAQAPFLLDLIYYFLLLNMKKILFTYQTTDIAEAIQFQKELERFDDFTFIDNKLGDTFSGPRTAFVSSNTDFDAIVFLLTKDFLESRTSMLVLHKCLSDSNSKRPLCISYLNTSEEDFETKTLSILNAKIASYEEVIVKESNWRTNDGLKVLVRDLREVKLIAKDLIVKLKSLEFVDKFSDNFEENLFRKLGYVDGDFPFEALKLKGAETLVELESMFEILTLKFPKREGQIYFFKGLHYGYFGEFVLLKEAYEKAISHGFHLKESYNNLGIILKWEFDDINQPLTCFKSAIEHDPLFVESYINLANLYIDFFEMPDLAKECLEKCIGIEPNYPLAYNNLALIYKSQHDYYKAEEILEDVLSRHPNYVEALENYAYILHYCLNNRYLAIEIYYRIIRINPHHASSFNDLGNIYNFYLDDCDLAREYYEKAIELNPNDAFFYVNYASLISLVYEEYDLAKESYEKAIMLDPTNAVNFFNYGLFMERFFCDYSKAKELYNKSIECDHKLIQARIRLAELSSIHFNEHTYSRINYEKVLEENYANIHCLNGLGFLYANHLNDPKKAKMYFERALKFDPENKVAKEYYETFLSSKTEGSPSFTSKIQGFFNWLFGGK